MRISILHCRHATSTGEKTFKEIKKTGAEYSLQVKQLRCVTIHGARNVCGTMTGLVGKMYRVSETAGSTKQMALHCSIHQQAFCGKSWNLPCLTDPIVYTLNFIRSSGLKHRR